MKPPQRLDRKDYLVMDSLLLKLQDKIRLYSFCTGQVKYFVIATKWMRAGEMVQGTEAPAIKF